MSRFSSQKAIDLKLSSQKTTKLDYEPDIDDLYNNSSKLNQLLDSWESEYGINVNYFMTMDYDAINKENITKWLSTCSKHDIEALKVIGQCDFFPLYEIFEESVSERIKLILEIGDKEQVLMTGIVQIHKNNNYYRINFSDKVDRSQYQIFAKITITDEANKQIIGVVNEAIIKIKSTTRTGFVAIIENLDKLNTNFTNMQITWLLVGVPNEINYYSINAQKISTLDSGIIMVKQSQKDILLDKFPKKLKPNSIMTLLYESSLLIRPEVENGKIKLIMDNLFDTDNQSESSEFTSSKSENNESQNIDDKSENDDDESEESEESESEDIEFDEKINYCFLCSNEEFIRADIKSSEYENIDIDIPLKIIGFLIN